MQYKNTLANIIAIIEKKGQITSMRAHIVL